MAKLYFKQAPMNAGKSMFLLANAHSFEERNIPFICLKPSLDTRETDEIIKSRIGIQRECIMVDESLDIYVWVKRFLANSVMSGLPMIQWIFVDEAQFLKTEQVNQLAHIVDELDINIICYGLRTDFTLHLFEGSKRLFEIADDIEEYKIACQCGRKAIVNARVNDEGEVIADGEQILIGGNEMYVPMCRKCYFEAIKNKNK